MVSFLAGRLLNAVLVIAGVIVVIFVLFTILPADPARMVLGQRADSASVEAINRDLGRNLPPFEQFILYVNDLSPLSVHSLNPESSFLYDTTKYTGQILFSTGSKVVVSKLPYLRRSYQSRQNVSEIIADRLPDTAVLAGAAIIIAIFAGTSMGIISALKKDTFTDRAIMTLSLAGVSVPSFFASVIFAWLFGYVLSGVTGLNMTGGLFTIDPFTGVSVSWKNLILPAIVLGMRPMAIIVQLTRSSMLDVLSQDYIRTARAKGLDSKTVIRKHALRNALNPVVTAVSGWLGSLLAGAVFIEFIFGWNGIGKLTVTALENYDLPVVMGIVLFISIVFVVLNIVADVVNGILDPRIRVGRA